MQVNTSTFEKPYTSKRQIPIITPELSFEEYVSTFIQRHPRYAIKPLGRPWKSRKRPLSDPVIKAHLNKQYSVGVLGKWYPEYCILDIDDRQMGIVHDIKEKLKLDERNSMLLSSESPNSYHILLRPQYNEKPPTIRLLQNILCKFGDTHAIEIYPQSSRVIRLPFGAYQDCLDYNYAHLKEWEDKLYWFQKLDDYSLSNVKDTYTIQLTPYLIPDKLRPHNILIEGRELLEHGLQMPSSRHEAQFKVIYHLWRQNIPLEEVIQIVWNWIKNKHNGFSKDIIRHPRRVKEEIKRQATHIYSKYEFSNIYPDNTHNTFHGYITKPDMQEIIAVCRASKPRMNYLFHIVKHYYPRRHRLFIPYHRDLLVSWSSHRTYLKYLNEFEEKGILQRGSSYSTDRFSKNIKLAWRFKNSNAAISFEGRAVDNFEDTIKLIYTPAELRELALKAGASKYAVSIMVKNIYCNA